MKEDFNETKNIKGQNNEKVKLTTTEKNTRKKTKAMYSVKDKHFLGFLMFNFSYFHCVDTNNE